ncbi:MAG: hypothetical protein JWR38_2749 [Mucilaginibacter sp.]|nr:hypothetical protein [Mucilaginibacter sp.]
MKLVFGLMLLCFTLHVKGQPPQHVALMTNTWDLIDLKSYKPNARGIYVAYFPPELKALNKKMVELPGYMIPIKSGLTHAVFMLSVLPVLQCQFCGQANIPSMVEVHVIKPVLYSESPVMIKGTLVLNDVNDSQSEFILTNAVLEDLK